MLIKGSIQDEDIAIVNLYAPNIGETLRQTLIGIRREIDSNTKIVGDFNTYLHQWTDHQSGESIRKHKP